MNLKHILEDIKNADADVYERLTERRHVLKSMGAKALAASLPVAVASLFTKSYGQTVTPTPIVASASMLSTLNYLLELEYFIFNYFHIGNSTGTLVPTMDQPALQTIETQDNEHIFFLRNLISTLGGTPFTPNHYAFNSLTGNPYSPYSYDFTASGKYVIYNHYPGDNNYPNFIELGQVLKDTMVRAYLGQIASLTANTGSALTSVMQMLTTDSRHASHIRLLRRFYPTPEYPKPWITNNLPPNVIFNAFYLGEDNVVQDTVNITNLVGLNGNNITETAATESFDEPLDQPTTLALLAPFILP